MPQFEEKSSWTSLRVEQHIDPTLLSDKRLSISQEMQPRFVAINRIAKNPAKLAEAEVQLIDEWAEKLFSAWIEIWDIQGLPRCHALYRAIFESELKPLFAARKSCFTENCQRIESRTRNPHFYSGALGWFAREVDKLTSKWNRRVDVESRKAMYAARNGGSDVAAVERTIRPQSEVTEITRESGDSGSNFTWKELEGRFREIQEKVTPSQSFYAWFKRKEWNTGEIEEGWTLGGTNLVCQKSFEDLALIAARKLGDKATDHPHEKWLHCVRRWMQETGLDKDLTRAWCPEGSGTEGDRSHKTEHLRIEYPAEMSAMYCGRLIALGIPESTEKQFQTIPQSQIATTKAPKRRPRRVGRFKTMQAVFAALQAGDEGLKYCQTVDRYKPPTPKTWAASGWPGSYTDAYKLPIFRKRIQDQKCKLRLEYDNISEQQREKIIQGEFPTRLTRK